MTSNIGTRKLRDVGKGPGFNTTARKESIGNQAKSFIEASLKRAFAPEFLNRLDDVILFNHLNESDILKIIEIELVKVTKRIKDLNYNIKISKKVQKFILEKGYDEKFGARPLKRVIQKYIEDIIAGEIINNKLKEGDNIILDVNKGSIIIK